MSNKKQKLNHSERGGFCTYSSNQTVPFASAMVPPRHGSQNQSSNVLFDINDTGGLVGRDGIKTEEIDFESGGQNNKLSEEIQGDPQNSENVFGGNKIIHDDDDTPNDNNKATTS